MGRILDLFRPPPPAAVTAALDGQHPTVTGAVVDPSTLPFASPWSGSSNLQRIVFEDIFGSDVPHNTRAAAMRLPAIARARNLFVSTIMRQPLRALDGDDLRPHQPSWLTRTGDGASPQLRACWTVDDLFFYGWSCWWRDNDAANRFPLAARRINMGSWTINADNRVEVDGTIVDDDQVILFSGAHEGILSYGVDVLADAHALYRIVRHRLATPVPQIDLHQTGGRQLTEPEIDSMIDRWAAARAGKNGGVSYSSRDIEPRELGAGGEQLMIEARNASALDCARIAGIAGSRIDATTPKATLNYETSTGRNQEFVDFDLALYATPIEARLSMDDVTPAGSRVAFDLEDFTEKAPTLTGPRYED